VWQDNNHASPCVKGPRKHTILVIDDEKPLRRLLHCCLEEAGYIVSEAPNGRSGVHAFRKTPTDLVITDIYMPERDGLEVIECLRRSRPTVKILVISGASGTMDYLKLARATGASALRKPFALQTLLGQVAFLIGKVGTHA
jgi:DNA-binding response OmpR family regulator